MGKVISEQSFLVHSDIGTLESKTVVIENYDVEDLMRNQALSQARLVKWVVEGKKVDINSPTGPATLSTPFFKNDEELLT